MSKFNQYVHNGWTYCYIFGLARSRSVVPSFKSGVVRCQGDDNPDRDTDDTRECCESLPDGHEDYERCQDWLSEN